MDGDHNPPPGEVSPTNYRMLSSKNINNNKLVDIEDCRYLSKQDWELCNSRTRLHKGDILLTTVATLGRSCVIETDEPICFQRSVTILTTLIYNKYLKLVFDSNYYQELMTDSAKGTAQKGFYINQVVQSVIPLPPLVEQKRIVTAIEKWMSIIDSMETNRMNILESIKLAKNSILDFAIHGKLVSQDPNDEPASELLKRINPKAVSSCDNPHYENVPFEIPSNWLWVKLGDVTNYGKCSTCSVDDINDESWILELEDIEKDTGRVLVQHTKAEREIKGVRHSFSVGNVLYSKLRTYLNKVLLAKDDGFCTTEIIPIECNESICPEYICQVLRSRYFLDYTAQCGYGVKMPRLSTTDARKALIPLPPFEEQIRITAKLNDLMSALDSIAETLV